MKRTLLSNLAMAGMALLLAAASAQASPQDAWITTKAKLTLLTTEGVSATAISVDTIDNQVTLHGKVNSADEKSKAEAAVAKLDGVKSVRNLLQVVPEKKEKSVQVSDDEIQRRVQKELSADQTLNDSKVEVKSVNDGVVLLGGTAATLIDHLRAVEDAARVPGVRRVASEIQSPDKLADNEVWNSQPPPESAKGGVTGTATDLWITSATKMSLLADSATPALEINVDTQDGVVTLFGIVPSAEAKKAAEADARKIKGVKNVRNELEIVPSKEVKKAVEEKDDQVADRLKATLGSHDEFKDVDVEVKNGVARLTGKVPSGVDRFEAAVVARSTAGVRSVRDDLTIAD